MLKHVVGLCFGLVVASTASAHPGHGANTTADAGYTMLHFLTEPIHLSGIAGVVALVAAVAAYSSIRARRAA